MVDFRADLARRFHVNASVPRADIFGQDDQQPLHLVEDANTMFAGYVGPNYQPGGVVLVAINPGGGGDAYRSRTLEDEQLYSRLNSFRDAVGDEEILQRFEDINHLFPELLAKWNIGRIVHPVLEAAAATLAEVAYLNFVPYRTRDDKLPRVPALTEAWNRLTHPALDALRPGLIIGLGLKAGNALARFPMASGELFAVPRTNGDSHISPEARQVLQDIANRAGGNAEPPAPTPVRAPSAPAAAQTPRTRQRAFERHTVVEAGTRPPSSFGYQPIHDFWKELRNIGPTSVEDFHAHMVASGWRRPQGKDLTYEITRTDIASMCKHGFAHRLSD